MQVRRSNIPTQPQQKLGSDLSGRPSLTGYVFPLWWGLRFREVDASGTGLSSVRYVTQTSAPQHHRSEPKPQVKFRRPTIQPRRPTAQDRRRSEVGRVGVTSPRCLPRYTGPRPSLESATPAADDLEPCDLSHDPARSASSREGSRYGSIWPGSCAPTARHCNG